MLIALFFIFVIYAGSRSTRPSPRRRQNQRGKRGKASPEFLWVAVIFAVVIGGMMAVSSRHERKHGTQPYDSGLCQKVLSRQETDNILRGIPSYGLHGHRSYCGFRGVWSFSGRHIDSFIAADWIALTAYKNLVMVILSSSTSSAVPS